MEISALAVLMAGPLVGYTTFQMSERIAAEEGIASRNLRLRAILMVVMGILVPVWAQFTGQVLATCLLGWLLLGILAVDWATLLIPRWLTMSLCASGLLTTWVLGPEHLVEHALGVFVGWSSVHLVARAYHALRGYEGLGAGDAVLVGAAAAWVGPWALPGLVATAALGGLLGHCAGREFAAARHGWKMRLPFGPYLALATWVTWTIGPIEFA